MTQDIIYAWQQNREVMTLVGELAREIRKLEVRLERFVAEEDSFVTELQHCLDRFRRLNQHLERVKTEPELRGKELRTLRKQAIEALSDALKKGSDTEHAKSHLLESYGALILALETAFQDVAS
jgi:hypothetical protein